MGIIENVKNYIDEKRINRLRRYMLAMQKTGFEYNPFLFNMPKTLVEKKNDVLELIEHIVWFSGSSPAIREFYSTQLCNFVNEFDNRHTYYAAVCPTNTLYIHSGLPKQIAIAQSSNIWNNGYSFDVKKMNDSGEVDDNASEELTNALYEILENNNIAEKLLRSGAWESATGDISWKLSFDFQLSHMPILEIFDRRNYDVVQMRGLEKCIEYKSYYEKKVNNSESKQFSFVETYGTDENGYAYILNNLYLIQNGKEIPVSLASIPETAHLVGREEIKFEYKGKLAWHKKNKEYSGVLSNYPYGSSDFTTMDIFSSIDESISQIIAEIRENKTLRFIDQSMLPVSDSGKPINPLGKYITNFMFTRGSQDQNSKKVEDKQFADKTEQHIKKLNTAIEIACAECGISPISLGLNGDIALNNSDKTLRERMTVSRDTATKKKTLWVEFLQEVLPSVLRFAKYLTTLDGYPTNTKALAFKKKLETLEDHNFDVVVTINPFEMKSLEEKMNMWINAKNGGVCSIDNAIQNIYGDTMTPDEIKIEVNRIKEENGLGFDSANNMLNLNTNDEDRQ